MKNKIQRGEDLTTVSERRTTARAERDKDVEYNRRQNVSWQV